MSEREDFYNKRAANWHKKIWDFYSEKGRITHSDIKQICNANIGTVKRSLHDRNLEMPPVITKLNEALYDYADKLNAHYKTTKQPLNRDEIASVLGLARKSVYTLLERFRLKDDLKLPPFDFEFRTRQDILTDKKLIGKTRSPIPSQQYTLHIIDDTIREWNENQWIGMIR